MFTSGKVYASHYNHASCKREGFLNHLNVIWGKLFIWIWIQPEVFLLWWKTVCVEETLRSSGWSCFYMESLDSPELLKKHDNHTWHTFARDRSNADLQLACLREQCYLEMWFKDIKPITAARISFWRTMLIWGAFFLIMKTVFTRFPLKRHQNVKNVSSCLYLVFLWKLSSRSASFI